MTTQEILATIRTQMADLGTSLDALDESLDTTTVTDAAGLTAALAKGGRIQLQPGRYVGNFTAAVPATLTGITTATGRIAPADVAGWTLEAKDRLLPVLTVTGSSVTVRGLTLTGVAPDRTTVSVGSNAATTVAQQPTGVTFDQVAILADAAGGHRGLEFHVADGRVLRSYLAGFVEAGRDSQAIWINNGSGPYRIEDNYLEASGENILIGGASVLVPGLVPSDIVIRGNTLFKPQAWRTRSGSVKNSLELKNARRVLIEDNVIDGCWKDAQAGNMIVFTPRNQNGDAPWTIVQDVTLRGNRTLNHTDGYAVSVLGTDGIHPSQRTGGIVLDGNYFADSVKGILISGGIAGLHLTNNTLPAIRWNLLTFTGVDPVKTALDYSRNVSLSGDYGANGDGTAPGMPTLAAYAPGYVWVGNVIEKTAARAIPWPAGTTLLPVGGLAPLLDAGGHYTGTPPAGW